VTGWLPRQAPEPREDGNPRVAYRRAWVEALKQQDDVQSAAIVHSWLQVDPVRFLAGTDVERAVWVAVAELREQAEKEARRE
jgi:hypothetical protein